MGHVIKTILFGGTRRASMSMQVVLTLLRVFAGAALLILHGLGKLPPDREWAEGMIGGAMGLPAPMLFGWAAALAESLGGLLLALGLLTRPAAFFVLCTMIGATFLHLTAMPGVAEAGWIEAVSAAELAMLFGLVALTFMVIGSGGFSIDALIRRKV